MKSLANATNGFMIISDSFITAIFKQSFLRSLSKDNQDYLRMGFNGTFEVLVSGSISPASCPLTTDHERAQDLRCHRSRYLRQQEVAMRRRN